MSNTLRRIQELVSSGEVRVSEHAYDELANDGIFATDLIFSLSSARVVEDYPHYGKGPCVLVLQALPNGDPIHAVWGIPKTAKSPAVLITGYRPDPDRWSDNFMTRKT